MRDKNILIRGLVQKYTRGQFRIEYCRDKCTLIDYFTRSSHIDVEDKQGERPSRYNMIYYNHLRKPLYIFLFCASVVLSVLVVFGEVLIFRGLSVETYFKKYLGQLNYWVYIVA